MIRYILAFLLLINMCAFAQQRPLTDQAVGKLADNYNTGLYTAIYNQFTPEAKAILSEASIIQLYKENLLPPLGRITSWNYVDEVKTNANYLVNFERGKMRLKIAVRKDLLITYYEWLPVKPEKEIASPKNTALIKNNNPKQTKLQLLLDSLALDYLRDPNNSSLSIGIVDGDVSSTYFYGETKKESGKVPDEKSLYEIGSISKTFTAFLLAHAVNEKKIVLTDDIRKYLPGEYPGLQYKGTPIRIVNLANHTSGLPRLPTDFDTSPGFNAEDPYKHYTKEMMYQYLKSFKPDTAAGRRTEYSNFGYAVLGKILENIYQKPLEELVKQTITGPLKMSSTNFKIAESEMALMTIGYSETSGKPVPYWQLGAFNAAGGLNSNIHDMLLYLKANMANVNPDFILSHTETNRQTDQSTALAWVLSPFRGKTVIWHNGGTAGFSSWCGYIKDKKLGVVILSNSGDEVNDIALELLSLSLKQK
ncbi:serine hydrolase [Pedobacter sp. MC2016-15]|uniref:serine hydrolase n=1 Tax=Pedobacter sp. MC2016-15 TaxID=2994473 RepID=UPI0022469C84|nr:serine hydrolase [Pedobacter sp. MC2016-15]MCX2480450.1 serine hydrolase [Pedobacter sp. MC2016-15]